MQKQRRSGQETTVQLWSRVLGTPQGIYVTTLLSSSAEQGRHPGAEWQLQAERKIPG